MSNHVEIPRPTQVYATPEGRAVIEQLPGSAVLLTADQILAVISELRACYDYCAAWKEPTEEPDRTADEAES